MKYIDAFPRQSRKFELDFAQTFAEDLVRTIEIWGGEATPMEVISIFHSCIDDINYCIEKSHKENKQKELYCVRIEMEILASNAIKLTFKPLNKDKLPLFGEKPLAVKFLSSDEEEVKEFRKKSGSKNIKQTFLPTDEPSEN